LFYEALSDTRLTGVMLGWYALYMQKPTRYIGFVLDETVAGQIEMARKPLIDQTTLKPLVPHVTVITPPMMSDVNPTIIRNRLEPILSQQEHLEVDTTGVMIFGGRLVCLGISSDRLSRLQQSIMQALGIDEYVVNPTKSRVYTPHITLLQSPVHGRMIKDKIDILSRVEFPKTIILRRIVVFEQVEKRQYAELDSFQLK
jgi:2'-5' RNA ligase